MRIYEKLNLEKPASISMQKLEIAKTMPIVELIKDAGNNYKKKEGILSPKSFFVIISGGEKRERQYFQLVSNIDNFGRIKIQFLSDPKQLFPDGLLETAISKQERYKTSQEDTPDKIFIVSDVDHFYNDLVRIKPECEKIDISLIINNSCFEIWLYYGKFDHKPTDFYIPADKLKISRSFKKYLDSKVKGGVNPMYAIFDIFVAKNNAKNNYEEDANHIPKLFSTNMFLLADEILPLIDIELMKRIEENKQKKRLFQKVKSYDPNILI